MKTKTYSAEVKGTFTQLKANKKSNAVVAFQQLDPTVRAKDVRILNVTNSHQAPVEDNFPL